MKYEEVLSARLATTLPDWCVTLCQEALQKHVKNSLAIA